MSGGGTLGLVNDLSVKLAKQRKQLGSLVKDVKSEHDSQLKWYHYVSVVVANNLVVITLGFLLGSAIYGIAPAEGGMSAGKITTTALEVLNEIDDQLVSIEAQGFNSSLSIRSPTTASFLLDADNAANAYEFSSPAQAGAGNALFQLKRAGEVSMQIESDVNLTDITFYRPTIVINDNLKLTADSVKTRNGSLSFSPARDSDLLLSPTGGGTVFVDGDTTVGLPTEAALKVGDPSATYMFDIRGAGAGDRTISVGSFEETGNLRIWGTSNISHPDPRPANCFDSDYCTRIIGNLIIKDGNMVLGNAGIKNDGNLGIGGDTVFGRFANDSLRVKSVIRFVNATNPVDHKVLICGAQSSPYCPADRVASIYTKGDFVVDEDAYLLSSVQFGSKSSHTVTVRAALTTVLNLSATDDVQLGQFDDHTVTLYGDLANYDGNGSLVFSIEQKKVMNSSIDADPCEVFANTSLRVIRLMEVNGSVDIGFPGMKVEQDGNETIVYDDIFSSDIPGIFHAHVNMNNTLTVDQKTTFTQLDGASYDMSDDLLIYDGYNTLANVHHESGNAEFYARFEMMGGATFNSSVDLASPSHIVTIHGDVKTTATLAIAKSLRTESNMEIDGEFNVGGHITVSNDSFILGDAYIGLDSAQIHTVHGNFTVFGDEDTTTVFKVAPLENTMHMDGSLTVQGVTTLMDEIQINAGAVVNGKALFGSKLRVDVDGIFNYDTFVDGAVVVQDTFTIVGNASANGDVILGSVGTQIVVDGILLVNSDETGPSVLSVDPGAIGVRVSGGLIANGDVSFDDHVDIASAAHGLNVYSTTTCLAPVTVQDGVTISDQLKVVENFNGRTSFATRSDSMFGETISALTGPALKIRGHLLVEDLDNTPILSVSKDTGSVLMTGQVTLQGNMIIGGTMDTPSFSANELQIDYIREITGSGNGVTIEGALFREINGGAIEIVKVGEMVELLAEQGVTVENMNCKGGAIVLDSLVEPCRTPTGRQGSCSRNTDLDMLLLTNDNHSPDMTNVTTSILFQQYYHHTTGEHDAANSARLTAKTASNWDADSTTHSAMFDFETTNQGITEQRLRLTPEGDLQLNTDKVQFDSELGNVNIQGDLTIGGGADSQNRSLTLISMTQSATLDLQSGGTGDSSLIFEQLDTMGRFTLRNYALATDYVDHPFPTLVLTDESVDLMRLNNQGRLWISGSFTTGEDDSVTEQSLRTQTTGPSSISIAAGASSDASVIVTSGPSQRAKLRLIDPADSVEGSTFEIFNDGLAPNATLRITDGIHDMVGLTDNGDTGSLQLSGDFLIQGNDTNPRTAAVMSQMAAKVHISSGYIDATCALTSGHNQNSMVILTDPSGLDPSSGSFDETHVFQIINIGQTGAYKTLTDWAGIGLDEVYHPMLSFQQGWAEEQYPLLSIDDVGALANVRVTGSGLFGSLTTAVPVQFKVQSGDSASASFISGPAFDATMTLQSGEGQTAKVQLRVRIVEEGETSISGAPDFSSFEIFNIASPVPDSALLGFFPDSLWLSTNPSLKTTFGEATDVMQIVDQGDRGDLAISGNGEILGGLGDGGRTLNVRSTDFSASLIVQSGENDHAIVKVQAEPNGMSTLVLDDIRRFLTPPESSTASFALRNNGISDTYPKFEIVDVSEALMLSLTDKGEVGDFAVSGNGQFGLSDALTDRSIRIESDQAANMTIQSGATSHANLDLVAGAGGNSTVTFSTATNVTEDIFSRRSFQLGRDSRGVNAFKITYADEHLLRIEDAGATGDVAVTGDGLVGSMDAQARTLQVLSDRRSMIDIQSGDFSDAVLELKSGPEMNAQITLEMLKDTGSDSFTLRLDGSENTKPMLNISDKEGYAMMLVEDDGTTGDLTISGNAIFGTAYDADSSAQLDTSLSVTAGQFASLEVIAETDTASIRVTGGTTAHQAKLMLSTRPEITPGINNNFSYYELMNTGPSMLLTNNATSGIKVLEVQDLGIAGKLEFSGDLLLTTVGQLTSLGELEPISVAVESGALAELRVDAGPISPAEMTLQSGDNRDAKFALVTTHVPIGSADPSYEKFEFVNAGTTARPELQLTDGTERILTVRDMGGVADFLVVGSLSCQNAASNGQTILGATSDSEITIQGHIVTPSLAFDGNRDGISLTLQFEDPAGPTTIVMPDESGTVLTTTSMFSTLTNVGALNEGSIDEGFGSIVTDQSISTSSSMTSAGSVTANSNFIATSDVQIGDSASDEVHFRGVLQQSMKFSLGNGVRFRSEDGLKTTVLIATFDSDSEEGDRLLIIPDTPTGGALHVVFNSMAETAANNVHQVAIDATAGVIRSYMNDLAPGEKNTIQLVSKRIKTDSVVIATIGCDGYRLCSGASTTGGWVLVTAVKVNNLDGGAAVVVRNVHPTQTMTTTFSINFAVFNSN